jgi:hypothetical protein
MVRRLLLPLLTGLALAACSDATEPSGTTQLTILLTDAPGDVVEAVVTIERIELVGNGGESGKLVLRDDPWTGDLLDLSNQVVVLVEDAIVPEGVYSQLRFIIPEACISVEAVAPEDEYIYSSDSAMGAECSGTPAGALQLPSFANTGIKTNLGGSIAVSGDQKVLLVDFDVSESFGHQAGASGMWVMTPVIHTTDFGLTGSISVSVAFDAGVTVPEGVALEDFKVSLEGTEELSLAEDGTATFLYLVPGDSPFSLDLIPPDGHTVTTDASLPTDVSVTSGDDVGITITITGFSG